MQFNGRFQFLSSLSGSTTGMQSSSKISTGVWPVDNTNAISFTLWHWCSAGSDCTMIHTFSIFSTLQRQDFLLHFLWSTGFREFSRILIVVSEYGRSGLYSDSETYINTNACHGPDHILVYINLYCRVQRGSAFLPYSWFIIPTLKLTMSSSESDELNSSAVKKGKGSILKTAL